MIVVYQILVLAQFADDVSVFALVVVNVTGKEPLTKSFRELWSLAHRKEVLGGVVEPVVHLISDDPQPVAHLVSQAGEKMDWQTLGGRSWR